MADQPRPAIFLDRDGTLIENIPYLGDPARVRLLPGTVEALHLIRQAGLAAVVVSNQSAVGRGIITEQERHLVQQEMNRQLAAEGIQLDGIYWCTYAPTTSDKVLIEHVDRKPGPGMLLRAARELGLDLAQSWTIGDQLGDMLAGRNAGCQGGILVRTGHDVTPALEILGKDWPVVDDVLAAVRIVTR